MRLTHDIETNTLRLILDNDTRPTASFDRLPGMIDVAENGRLVGVELRFGFDVASVRQRLQRWTSDPVAGEFTTIESDGTAYIELTSGDPDDTVLSSPLELGVESDDAGEMLAVSIPRRGAGYEISYPSGNR